MQTIAHLADLHLGYSHLSPRAADGRNQRLVDFERAALICAQHLAEEIRPDAVVIAGDLAHETQLYPAALSGAASFCDLLTSAGIPVIAIGGNHDEAEGAGRFNALRFLAQHHGLDLHLEQSHADVGATRLHLVSFRVLSRAERRRGEMIAPFEFDDTLANVLVTHGYAPGNGVPEIPAEREVRIPEEWLTDPRFDACLLGHIHHHTRLRDEHPVFYAGSLERRNFGESAERPGFWLHHFDGGKLSGSESVYVDQISDELPRPMIDRQIDCTRLTVDELDKRVVELIESESVPGVMMRVVLDNVSAELDRHQARGQWERRFRKLGGLYFESATRSRQMAELMDVKFSSPPIDVGQGFLEFIAAQQLDDPELSKQVSELAESVVAEAAELLLAQEADG